MVVVRFSEDEHADIVAAAGLAGLAVGAWVGERASTTGVDPTAALMRLHADVTALSRTDSGSVAGDRVAALLDRIDAALDDLLRGR